MLLIEGHKGVLQIEKAVSLMEIAGLLERLKPKERSGSKPRCHLLTHGSPEQVSRHLTALIRLQSVRVSPSDTWMPQGFEDTKEAQLHRTPQLFPNHPELCQKLRDWWLAVIAGKQTLPSFDIASTCTVRKRQGLLLVEAKAHNAELIKDPGKPLSGSASTNSYRNHLRIGSCIQEANHALAEETNMSWALSRDRKYQISNRFAWAWKLTELGIPVILVYLGFLNAEEMRGKKREPFLNHGQWEELVRSHSVTLFPSQVWNHKWEVNKREFIPLIRSINQSLDGSNIEAEE